MSSRPRSPQSERKTGARRGKGGPSARVNRSQQRAMEIRAAATRSRELHERDSATIEAPTAVASAGAVLAAGTRRARRPTARAAVMNREDEYRYIREDMMRLVLTASILLVVMLAVLIVV